MAISQPHTHVARLAGLIGLLGGSLAAQALPAALDIDFRSPSWAAADDNASFTVGDVTATANPSRATLRQNSTDGLGIATSPITDDPNEIGPRETLQVSFANPVALEGVWLTKLFDELFDDSGTVELFNGVVSLGLFSFSGTDDGELFVDFGGPLEATEVTFKATESGNLADFVRNRDYSVVGFVVGAAQPVPDAGATLLLLGLGVSASVLARRRRA